MIWTAFTGFETKNKYSVVNVRGEPVFYVAEESSCCARCCMGPNRPCELAVFDNARREILRMVRPFRCDSCCCPCCLQVFHISCINEKKRYAALSEAEAA